MRPDQLVKLTALQEKLADVVIVEADPVNWPGEGKAMAALTQAERGDRYWSKKNAAATFSLLERCTVMLAMDEMPAPSDPDGLEIDKQIARREREAEKLLNEALGRAKKSAFDERVRRR